MSEVLVAVGETSGRVIVLPRRRRARWHSVKLEQMCWPVLGIVRRLALTTWKRRRCAMALAHL